MVSYNENVTFMVKKKKSKTGIHGSAILKVQLVKWSVFIAVFAYGI